METVMMTRPVLKKQLKDILLDISWAKIASRYFDRSPSWIHQKIDGLEDSERFTPSELK